MYLVAVLRVREGSSCFDSESFRGAAHIPIAIEVCLVDVLSVGFRVSNEKG